MSDKPNVLRDTDNEARTLARTLLRGARSASLAAIEPESGGFPFVSRVLVGMDVDGSAGRGGGHRVGQHSVLRCAGPQVTGDDAGGRLPGVLHRVGGGGLIEEGVLDDVVERR